tara:strand:+ start:87 stop:680 length:594 start_codon:yes stop_codon:yes gene_type:complete
MDPHQNLQKGEFLGYWTPTDGEPVAMYELVPPTDSCDRYPGPDDDDYEEFWGLNLPIYYSDDEEGDSVAWHSTSADFCRRSPGPEIMNPKDWDLYVPSTDAEIDAYCTEAMDVDYGYEFDNADGDRTGMTLLHGSPGVGTTTATVAALYELVYGLNSNLEQLYFAAVDEDGELIDVEMPVSFVKRSDYRWYSRTYLY